MSFKSAILGVFEGLKFKNFPSRPTMVGDSFDT